MTLNDKQFDADGLQWSERPVRLQQRFLVLRKLGQGTYGKVQLALNKESNQEVAIKTIKKARIESEEDMLRIRREIQIMAAIRHPHIIHINEVFETRQKIVIVMQYASGGELYDYLGCHQKLPEEEARRVFRQIASAIYYCHKNRICHRDLKLENILLDEEGNAQIADFGLSNIFDERRRMSTFCGSPLYASPEIVKGTPYKGPEVDCWSLGVLLYTLIYGTMPFDGRNFKELVSQISEGKYAEPANKSRASSLIRSLLTPDISKRATIMDVCKDTWVNDGYKESLLKLAEQMASENHLNGENLISPKICLEKISKNGYGTSFPLKTHSLPEKSNGKINLTSVLKNCIINPTNQKVCDKPNLYEQILSYDVRFIINKLLTAVESTLSEKETRKYSTPVKEKSTPKIWPKNGEIGTSSKVDSAYVIPIFEVTSVVPKLPSKITNFYQNKISSKQNFVHRDHNKNPNYNDSEQTSEKDKEKIKNGISTTKQNISIPRVEIFHEVSNKEKNQSHNFFYETISGESDNRNNVFDQSKHLNKDSEDSLMVNQENSLPRVPTPKSKKKDENIFYKKIGPFFRTKNHALSIARIFSMNFDKLNSSSRKLRERRQERSPGKVVIPATFDPSCIEKTVEQKQIFIFPTISVSENKERIEKKIDKIKKAALNMNLTIRSNSQNRLKIQKYLKSQAKKIQDLVFDERRIINGGKGWIKRSETISAISDAYFGKIEKRFINSFNVGHHCKKINFLSPNNDSIETSHQESHQINFYKENCFLLASPDNMVDEKSIFNISKSRSEEIRFPNSFDSHFNYHQLKADMQNAYENEIKSLKMISSQIPEKFLYLTSNSHEMLENISNETSDFHGNSEKMLQNSQENASELTKSDNLSDKDLEQQSCASNAYLESNAAQIDNELNISELNDLLSQLNISQIDLHDKSTYRSNTKLKRLASEPSLKYDIKTESPYSNITKPESIQSNKGGIKRRNTLSSITEFSSGKKYISLKERHENNAVKRDDFHDCLWMMYVNKKILNAHENNEIAFLSSPNIYNLSQYKSFLNNTSISSKSVDEINQTFYEAALSNNPVYGLKEAKSAFLRKLLQKADSNGINSYKSTTHKKRGISVSEEILSNNEKVENIRKAQSERKLSLPHGIDTWDARKTPFLSKFLSELERREFAILKGNNTPRKPYKQNPAGLGKKVKSENRNKSFLQLMALKRIQEAEKELSKVERNDYLENEDENSGSLLEALKTHGYKNVISQRFQTDDDTDDLFSFRYPMNLLTKRTLMKDIPRAYSNNFDSIVYNSPIHLDYGEYNEFIEPTSPLSFHPEACYSPKLSKQFVQDWLTTNLSEKYLDSSRKLERTVPIIPEERVHTLNCNDRRFLWEKESSQSLEEEPSSSDSFDLSKECNMNGIRSNDLNTVSEDTSNHINGDQNYYFRTSSTSDDEKEESVQDRIWRKSFYSRFNNSALSRKERSRYLDASVISERSSLFNFNGSSSSFMTLPRERSESFQANGYKKNSSLKRAATLRPQRSRKDSTDSENSFKIRSSKSFKHTPTDYSQKLDTNNHVASAENAMNQ